MRLNWRRANRSGGGDAAAADGADCAAAAAANRTRSELRVQRLLNRPGVRDILESRIRFDLCRVNLFSGTILNPFTESSGTGKKRFLGCVISDP